MRKHGNVVLTLAIAITWHFYWTYASLMISCYLHEQLQNNGSLGRSGTQIAEHRVAIEHRNNICFNFRGATAVFLAYQQWK